MLALLCLLLGIGACAPAMCGQRDDREWLRLMLLGKGSFYGDKFPRSYQYYIEALREAERFGSEDPRYWASLRCVADVLMQLGRWAEAEQFSLRELDILRKLGEDFSNLAPVYARLAEIQCHFPGHERQARDYALRAVTIREQKESSTPPRLCDVLAIQVVISCLEKNDQEALLWRQKTLKAVRALRTARGRGNGYRSVGYKYAQLAMELRARGDYQHAQELLREGVAFLEQSVDVMEDAPRVPDGDVQEAYTQLLWAARRLGDPVIQGRVVRRRIRFYARHHPDERVRDYNSSVYLGEGAAAAGNYALARQHFRQALKEAEQLADVPAGRLSGLCLRIGMAAGALNDDSEMIEKLTLCFRIAGGTDLSRTRVLELLRRYLTDYEPDKSDAIETLGLMRMGCENWRNARPNEKAYWQPACAKYKQAQMVVLAPAAVKK